jgi:hypothetical protein
MNTHRYRNKPKPAKEHTVDRLFAAAAIVFVALAVAGIALVELAGTTADAAALRPLGAAMFGAALASFIVEAFSWARARA